MSNLLDVLVIRQIDLQLELTGSRPFEVDHHNLFGEHEVLCEIPYGNIQLDGADFTDPANRDLLQVVFLKHVQFQVSRDFHRDRDSLDVFDH